MKPLVKASNTLQSESGTYKGCLLPVIHQLLSKLNRMETSSEPEWPAEAFWTDDDDPELVAAVVLLPKFKTSCTDTADVIEAGKVKSA